jgi:FkbM family methyltransferase
MSTFSTAKRVAKDLLPPLLTRTIGRLLKGVVPLNDHELALDRFYRQLVPPRGLCFDIGANIGNRLASFRRLGFRVVALEPQSKCFSTLQTSYGRDSDVILLKKAVGTAPGTASMMISETNTLSTLSTEFIKKTTESGRFKDVNWSSEEEVQMVTLDQLVKEYGAPDFVKIDVEGYELEVVRGLSSPLKMISLEWAPEMTDRAIACLDHLSGLGPVSYNLSFGEGMRFARKEWMNEQEVKMLLNLLQEQFELFADIYVRSEMHHSSQVR